jgi:kynurenine formamidase
MICAEASLYATAQLPSIGRRLFDRLLARRITLMAPPLKLSGGSGAPCRVVAMIDEQR